jgi:hypothetical protein
MRFVSPFIVCLQFFQRGFSPELPSFFDETSFAQLHHIFIQSGQNRNCAGLLSSRLWSLRIGQPARAPRDSIA